jgi:hypothetical protein
MSLPMTGVAAQPHRTAAGWSTANGPASGGDSDQRQGAEMNKTLLEVVLQRDRVIVAAGLGGVVVLA